MTAVLPGRSRLLSTTVGAAVLVLLTAATWFVWAGWSDPPYAPWRMAGLAVTAAALAILAPRWLPAWVVGIAMPPAFTVAWSLTAAAADDSGLWAVGALFVLVGGIVAVLVLVPLGVALRPVRLRGPHGLLSAGR